MCLFLYPIDTKVCEENQNPKTQLLEIYRLVGVKNLAGIIVTKKVVLERKDSLFDTPEFYQPILLPCLRCIIMFNNCTRVQAGW